MKNENLLSYEVGKLKYLFQIGETVYSATPSSPLSVVIDKIPLNEEKTMWVEVQRGTIKKMPTNSETGEGYLYFTFSDSRKEKKLCTIAKTKKMYYVYMDNDVERMLVYRCTSLKEARTFIRKDGGGKRNEVKPHPYLHDDPRQTVQYFIYDGEEYVENEEGDVVEEREPLFRSPAYWGE